MQLIHPRLEPAHARACVLRRAGWFCPERRKKGVASARAVCTFKIVLGPKHRTCLQSGRRLLRGASHTKTGAALVFLRRGQKSVSNSLTQADRMRKAEEGEPEDGGRRWARGLWPPGGASVWGVLVRRWGRTSECLSCSRCRRRWVRHASNASLFERHTEGAGFGGLRNGNVQF